jgi:hypothetical protein
MGNTLYKTKYSGTEVIKNRFELKNNLLNKFIINTLKKDTELQKRACCIGSSIIYVRLPFVNNGTLDETVVMVDFSKDEDGGEIKDWKINFCLIDQKNYGYVNKQLSSNFGVIDEGNYRAITDDTCSTFYKGTEENNGFCSKIKNEKQFENKVSQDIDEINDKKKITINTYSDCNCINSPVHELATNNNAISSIASLLNPYSSDKNCKENSNNLHVFRDEENQDPPCISIQEVTNNDFSIDDSKNISFDFEQSVNCVNFSRTETGTEPDTGPGPGQEPDPDPDPKPKSNNLKYFIIAGIILIIILFILYNLI